MDAMLAFVLYILIVSPADVVTTRLSFVVASREECQEIADIYLQDLRAIKYDEDSQGIPAFVCMKTLDL